MKKIILILTSLLFFGVGEYSFALLWYSSCGSASGQAFSSWADANAARSVGNSCTHDGIYPDGYIMQNSNIITHYTDSSVSTWNCAGWNWSFYVATATCSVRICSTGYILDGFGGCRLPICLINPPNTLPANAYHLSDDELPASLKLTQDYPLVLRWSIEPNQYEVSEVNRTWTIDGCEYTCDPGYIPNI